jgi:exosortase C (VPDSG-CTERM-specific)
MTSDPANTPSAPPSDLRWPKRALLAWVLLLLGCFAVPLRDLVRFALHNELYSHILLIPSVSAWLIWTRRKELPRIPSKPSPLLALVAFLAGLLLLAGYWVYARQEPAPRAADYLFCTILSFLSLALAGALFLAGMKAVQSVAFPAALLLFVVPFPYAALQAIESFLQHGSSDVASLLFALSGMPVLRTSTVFQMPGITLEVAPECSGIHSTLALFITSLVAGYVLLRNPWRRSALALAVIPLALLRNGFRIFVIGQLCVRISPDMINSPIHRKGGPLFFALSLVPLFGMLLWFRRSERAIAGQKAPSPKLQISSKLQTSN